MTEEIIFVETKNTRNEKLNSIIFSKDGQSMIAGYINNSVHIFATDVDNTLIRSLPKIESVYKEGNVDLSSFDEKQKQLGGSKNKKLRKTKKRR
jgi:hypothetical protein